MAAACRIGGIVNELPEETTEQLTIFGRSYGLAFQVVDDILDLTATDEELGKPAGNDMIEGVYTLPVIRAMAHGEVGKDLQQLLGRPIDTTARDEAREIVRASGALKSAHADAKRHAEAATNALSSFSDTAGGAALKAAADHLVDRVENLVV